jgi:hypothetical protein
VDGLANAAGWATLSSAATTHFELTARDGPPHSPRVALGADSTLLGAAGGTGGIHKLADTRDVPLTPDSQRTSYEIARSNIPTLESVASQRAT